MLTHDYKSGETLNDHSCGIRHKGDMTVVRPCCVAAAKHHRDQTLKLALTDQHPNYRAYVRHWNRLTDAEMAEVGELFYRGSAEGFYIPNPLEHRGWTIELIPVPVDGDTYHAWRISKGEAVHNQGGSCPRRDVALDDAYDAINRIEDRDDLEDLASAIDQDADGWEDQVLLAGRK